MDLLLHSPPTLFSIRVHRLPRTIRNITRTSLVCLLLLVCWNSAASAASISGTGADGPLVVTGTTFVDDVKSPVSGNVLAGQSFIPLMDTSGFAPGDELFIYTAQGSTNSVGSYRFQTIQSVSPTGVTIHGQMNFSLDVTNDKSFVQKVPNYSNVTVQSGGVITASPWDGTMGGVVAFRAQGELDIQTGGAILADGLGFRGGPSVSASGSNRVAGVQGESYQGPGAQGVQVDANGTGARNFGGGGGGLGESAGGDVGGGGGGGSYGDLLGTSGLDNFNAAFNSAGEPGESYGEVDLSKIFFGSGGGSGGADNDSGDPAISGAGGNGGGIIYIALDTLKLNGTLRAAGADGGDAEAESGDETGGGGGGSGGSLRLVLAQPSPLAILDASLFTPGGLGGADTSSFILDGGQGGVGRAFAASVPEPASGLFLLGTLPLLCRVRRRLKSPGRLSAK